MGLNDMIDITRGFVPTGQTRQQQAIQQDGQAKAAFALALMQRIPQEPAKPEEPPRIPSLGALAIPN